jgi:hypothetical protein
MLGFTKGATNVALFLSNVRLNLRKSNANQRYSLLELLSNLFVQIWTECSVQNPRREETRQNLDSSITKQEIEKGSQIG